MSTKRVLSFLQKGWTAFVDPDREERLSRGVSIIHRALSEQRDAFDLATTAGKHQIDLEDWAEIARRIYQKCLTKAWGDGEVSAKELRTLDWVAKHLRLSEQDASQQKREQAEKVFAAVLSDAFSDGVLDEAEFARLADVARTCDSTPANFFRTRFRDQGEEFLQQLFARVLTDGELTPGEWRAVTETVGRLGMTESEFRDLIHKPAEQFIEHLLADFKSDEQIDAGEEACLNWALNHLLNDPEFTGYVQEEISQIKRLTNLRLGILPSVQPPAGVALKAGEIVHFLAECRFVSARRRGGDSPPDAVVGQGVITDDRFVFTSPEQSLQVIHSKVLGYQQHAQAIEIQCVGSAAGLYRFPPHSQYGPDIWLAAIRKANQTLVTPRQTSDARYIPRDVRQRVWQRYGGQCAECNSTHYLEFDHIIPVTRGGGNSDNNVQLLCRGCNGRKSDNI
jgi:hypothetical protein